MMIKGIGTPLIWLTLSGLLQEQEFVADTARLEDLLLVSGSKQRTVKDQGFKSLLRPAQLLV